jgi:hypothetical protein
MVFFSPKRRESLLLRALAPVDAREGLAGYNVPSCALREHVLPLVGLARGRNRPRFAIRYGFTALGAFGHPKTVHVFLFVTGHI